MLTDNTKDAILESTMVWGELASDIRWEYITDLTDTERTNWGLETDTVAVAVFRSEHTGRDWYEWDVDELESVLTQDAAHLAMCHCFVGSDDPAMTDPDCPVYHNSY